MIYKVFTILRFKILIFGGPEQSGLKNDGLVLFVRYLELAV